jgi:hypothetical protein
MVFLALDIKRARRKDPRKDDAPGGRRKRGFAYFMLLLTSAGASA